MELKIHWPFTAYRAYLFKLVTLVIACLVFTLVYWGSNNIFASVMITLAVSGAVIGLLTILPIMFEDWTSPIETIIARLTNFTVFAVPGFILAVLIGVALSKYCDSSIALISGLSIYLAAIFAGYLHANGDMFQKGNGLVANIGSGIIQAVLMQLILVSIYKFFQ